jgi:hypothetical protein
MINVDQRIEVFVGKLADAAPPPIEFEQLGSARTAPSRTRKRPALLVVAPLAVIGVVIGLLAISDIRRSEPDAGSTPIVPAPSTIRGVPFAVVPSMLPEGWRYVDLSDSGTTPPRPAASSFLFRDPRSGAALFIQTAPFLDPDPVLIRDLRGSFEETGAATWVLDDSSVWMRVAGLSTDRAVVLAQQLRLEDSGGERVPQLPDSSFELEASRPSSAVPNSDGSIAQLRLATPNGTVDVVLNDRDPGNSAWNHFGVPTVVGDRTAYVSTHSVTGDPIDGQITAAVQVSNPADLDGATQLFASLERAPLDAWDRIADGIADQLSAMTLTDGIEIRDLTVTRHRDGTTIAICASWHGTVRCRSNQSPLWGSAGTGSVNLVVGGLWVIAGTVDNPDGLPRFNVASGVDDVIGTSQPTDTGVFFGYAVPAATHVEIEFKGQTNSGEFGFDRPAR